MDDRAAQPTHDALARYRRERDALLAQARANHEDGGDAGHTAALVAQARERQRKVMWARRVLGLGQAAPDGRAYHGFRDEQGTAHVRVVEPGDLAGRPLLARLDLARKSPTGFEWAYGGSGPAQLALALCADALGDDMAALALFQSFKFQVVAKLAHDEPWTLTAAEVRRHCQELQAEARKAGR